MNDPNKRTDDSIREDVIGRLQQHAQIDADDIQVEVQKGKVIIKGSIENHRMNRMVEANIERIDGVVAIDNQLELRNPESPEQMEKERQAREMADKFPGGPTPTGPAGYDPKETTDTDR